MAKSAPEATLNLNQLRKRLRESESAAAVADLPATDTPAEALSTKSSIVIPRPRAGSGLGIRGRDVSTRTPLPNDAVADLDLGGIDLDALRAENDELRQLIEQAIVHEEGHERSADVWSTREAELINHIGNLQNQIELFQNSGGDAGQLLKQLNERDEANRALERQVSQLHEHIGLLQQSQSGEGAEQLAQAVLDRDAMIELLNGRVAELEAQIALIPPPVPTDEELARMADELERERCQVTQLRKQLDDDQKLHTSEVSDFERQMRDMEVQMSKERAEMARQRTELVRLQAELQAEMEAMQRGDVVLRDRLAQFKRPESAQAGTSATAPKRDKDSGFMNRLFGKK